MRYYTVVDKLSFNMMECFIVCTAINLPNELNTVFILIKPIYFTKPGPWLMLVWKSFASVFTLSQHRWSQVLLLVRMPLGYLLGPSEYLFFLLSCLPSFLPFAFFDSSLHASLSEHEYLCKKTVILSPWMDWALFQIVRAYENLLHPNRQE